MLLFFFVVVLPLVLAVAFLTMALRSRRRPLLVGCARSCLARRRLRVLLIWSLLVNVRLFLTGARHCLGALRGLVPGGYVRTRSDAIGGSGLHCDLGNWTSLQALAGCPADWVNARSLVDHNSSLHAANIACLALEIIDHRCAVNDGRVIHEHGPGSYRFMEMADVHECEE